MFYVPVSHPAQKRTLRPLYANHQATPWGGFLDPTWDKHFDILPGTVMQRVYGEVFAPYVGAAGTTPFGLSALFVAPGLEVNEVTGDGTNLFTVWVGGNQAAFEILAPAFDVNASWPTVTGPGQYMLTANSQGRLTPAGVNEGNVVAELIDVPSVDKIVVRLNQFDLTSAAAIAGGS